MKRKSRKLVLSRETLRRLDERRLSLANGAATLRCDTDVSECEICYTTDVTDCPGCVFTGACQSLACPSGVGTGCTCGC